MNSPSTSLCETQGLAASICLHRSLSGARYTHPFSCSAAGGYNNPGDGYQTDFVVVALAGVGTFAGR
jgi:hypothetical protein